VAETASTQPPSILASICLQNGRTAVGASAFAMLLASLLTIAASGLYTLDRVAKTSAVKLVRFDEFINPVKTNLDPQGITIAAPEQNYTAILAARLAIHRKMGSPKWTFGPYVLPKVSSVPNGSQTADTLSTITAEIPIQKGHLACTLISTDQVTLNYTLWDGLNKSGVFIKWLLANASACLDLGQGSEAQDSASGLEDGFWASWKSFQELGRDENAPCPTSWAVFGQWQGRHAKELNVVSC
jgi:hypothetical protein